MNDAVTSIVHVSAPVSLNAIEPVPAALLALVFYTLSSFWFNEVGNTNETVLSGKPEGLIMLLVPALIIFLFLKGKHLVHGLLFGPELKQALNAFVKRMYKSEFYNVIYLEYFKNRGSVQRLARGRIIDALKGQISPYDELVRKYSDHYGFDWRLVTAQMYQESKFNPEAKSHIGARGLMQLMPRTAKEMGVKDISDPASSIRGGVKYLDWLRDRFDADLVISDRLWFTLAAYNAGAGHVQDARRLAGQLGHDPDRWFGHTEQAMLLLEKKQYKSS